MLRSIRLFLLLIILSNWKSSSAQTYTSARGQESDKLSLAVIRRHLNDSFYMQMRKLPSVRYETQDYILRHDGKKWTARFSNKCSMKHACTFKSQTVKAKATNAMTIAQNVNLQRLLLPPISDSINRNIDSLLQGSPSYFIIICSRGKVRKIEYPFSHHDNKTGESNKFWHSDYLERILIDLEKLSVNAKQKHR